MDTGRRNRIRIRNKRYDIEIVDIQEEASDLTEFGYQRPDGRTVGLVHPPASKILIDSSLDELEAESTALHEVMHLAAPRLSERTIRMLEKHLFPVLHANGLRLLKEENE